MISFKLKNTICQLSVYMTLLASIAFTGVVAAEECRVKSSVQNSGISANNNSYGGHVNQHIFGATPPPGTSQNGKTLFSSVVEYTGFWNNYINPKKFTGPGVNCSGTHVRQNVSVYSVLKKNLIGGYSCKGADAQGKCNSHTRSQFSRVQLDFEIVGGQWILLTAYPTN